MVGCGKDRVEGSEVGVRWKVRVREGRVGRKRWSAFAEGFN